MLQVGLHELAGRPKFLDGGRNSLPVLLISPADHDTLGTVAGCLQRNSLTDTLRAPGDDQDLSVNA